ncbi:MAG: helix-turn-helix domain-containing protein [Planctomycetes bacterium]|nr:helix-turn-helix domain-containing protein [Planctomycetota bacterium]
MTGSKRAHASGGGRPSSGAAARPDFPYTMRLPDGRTIYIDVPGRFTAVDRSGEVAFTSEGVRFLDRIRAAATPLRHAPTPGYLAALRDALALTQKEMGELIGVNKLTISRWERGTLRPSPESIRALERLRKTAARKGVLVAG